MQYPNPKYIKRKYIEYTLGDINQIQTNHIVAQTDV
jgi:hypothetical protein